MILAAHSAQLTIHKTAQTAVSHDADDDVYDDRDNDMFVVEVVI